MKKSIQKIAVAFLAIVFILPAAQAQDNKDKKKNKDVEQIIVTVKGDKEEKLIIEVDGDKVIVNGKDAKDMKEGDVSVKKFKMKGATSFTVTDNQDFNWNNSNQNTYKLMSGLNNRAMLGVVTESVDNGARVKEVSEESAAEKAGIKQDDIITKVDDAKIENADDLSKAIREHKPGEKITVTYLRGKKENKVTAELGKTGGAFAFNAMPDLGQNIEIERQFEMPRVQGFGNRQNFNGFSWSGDNDMRLGMSVQDTEDGKGVKVIEVEDETNAAKSGIQEDDIITEFAGQQVNSADEVAKLYREKKKQTEPIAVKVLRDGKTQNLEIKIPRKLKTADL